jgi:hypothetical protein
MEVRMAENEQPKTGEEPKPGLLSNLLAGKNTAPVTPQPATPVASPATAQTGKPAGTPVAQPAADRQKLEADIAAERKKLDADRKAFEQEKNTLNQRADALAQAEIKRDAGYADERAKFDKELAEKRKAFDAEIAAVRQGIEREKADLNRRASELTQAELRRDEGYADERRKLDEELKGKRATFDAEIVALRQSRFAELEQHLENERTSRINALNAELERERKTHQDARAAVEQELARRTAELDQREEDLNRKNEAADLQLRKLAVRSDGLDKREQSINDKVEQRIAERKKSFEAETAQAQDECERLRKSIQTSQKSFSQFDELQRKLGGKAPEVILTELNSREEIIKNLRAELLERPTKEVQEEFERIKAERDKTNAEIGKLKEENDKFKAERQEAASYEARIEELEEQKMFLAQKKEYFETQYGLVLEDIKRLQASYKRDEERSDRVKTIESPLFTDERQRRTVQVSEIEWLNGLNKSIKDYGFAFPERLLYAFHTALKTAELSTITVLAGVSGTGKSKLPELYAHFGGLNFLSLPVQPNWDSKESMLGFFNTLEGKFDAQPALRFLAQTQKSPSETYPYGLADVMNIILLDEMNLAHVELYFAEFLSKLEERRGMDDSAKNFPKLPVQLGSGMAEDYMVPMGRNVLWVGTMNQDETTKSLSDKVLDRGIVINFPRPSTLVQRKSATLPPPVPLLTRKQWDAWRPAKNSIADTNYKDRIEEINGFLAKVGRSLGHRVWQSIEQYMTYYPTVLQAQQDIQKSQNDEEAKNRAKRERDNALKTAFEDQLVQKIMPKLRGIETGSKQGNECLAAIKKMLVDGVYNETLIADFEKARAFGDGQFIWNSSDYLYSTEDTDAVAQEPDHADA